MRHAARLVVHTADVEVDSDTARMVAGALRATMWMEKKPDDASQPTEMWSGLSVEASEGPNGLMRVTWFYPAKVRASA